MKRPGERPSPHGRERAWWRACLAAGLAVLGLVLWMSTLEPVACGPGLGLRSVLAFELVGSVGDVAALFGTEPCRGALVQGVNAVNTVDALAFIPAFTVFLVLGATAVRRQGTRLAALAIVAALLAAGCDETENQILFGIGADLPGTASQIAALFWVVRAKFVLLSVAVIAIGWLTWRHRGRVNEALGWTMIAGGSVAIAGVCHRPWYASIPVATGLAWAALLLLAVRGAMVRGEARGRHTP